MSHQKKTRREFIKKSSLAIGSAAVAPYWMTARGAWGQEPAKRKYRLGAIGCGDRSGQVIGRDGASRIRPYADVVAVCDVDRNHMQLACKQYSDGKADQYEDYRRILDRDDIDVVTIVTPDHWHSKIAIEAMKAGKDVYCEKPLTLTIDEGKKICQVAKETGQVFQVGTQQRSEMGLRFLQALAIIRDGRIGDIQRVQCAIGGSPVGGPFKKTEPPKHLNWDMWLGQTPFVDYIPERAHLNFRWWYEYSGGKMTDWGAHHVDIAQWAIGQDHSGPTSVTPVTADHPVPMKDGMPTQDDRYNAASKFLVKCDFPNNVEMTIRSDTDNGILFEGTKGRLFVNRGKITGKPVDELADNPLPEDAIQKVYKGNEPGSHMRNFFECVESRKLPISDVYTHHRSMTTCHLANIAIRLNRPLSWNPETEQIVGDEAAAQWQSREQRKGYEIVV